MEIERNMSSLAEPNAASSLVQCFDPRPFKAGNASVSPVLSSRVICKWGDEVSAALNEFLVRLIHGDPNKRLEQLSAELRQIEDEWRKIWFTDQMPGDKPRE